MTIQPIEISHISLLHTDGTDVCLIHTTLPGPYTGYHLKLMFYCAHSTAVEYCARYFPGVEIKNV